MYKFLKNLKCKNILLLLFVIGIIYILFIYKTPIQEGVVFTKYDRSKLFTKPWSKFCTPNPPGCQHNLMNAPEVDGSPLIGCWCNKKGQAPLLDATCDDVNN